MSILSSLMPHPTSRYSSDNGSMIELLPLPAVPKPAFSSSSSSNLSSRTVSAQSAPTRSAAATVFSILPLHCMVRSWLGEEGTFSARVCRAWRDCTSFALRTYHSQRRSLSLSQVMPYFPQPARTPTGILMYSGGKFPRLRSLDLSSGDDEAIAILIARIEAPALRELSLPRSKPINVDALPSLSRFEHLTFLNLMFNTQVSETCISTTLAGCPHLTSLNLSYCEELNGAAVRKMAVSCPNLTSLNLSNCLGIRKEGLLAALTGCPKLTSLNLSHCRGLDEPATREIDALYPHLTSLDLSCSDVDDATISDLAWRCPNLMSLNLNGCDELTSTSLLALAARCPKLTSLHLSACRGVNRASIRALIAGCPNLTSLNLSLCSKVNKAALREIANGCPNLTSFSLLGSHIASHATAVMASVTKYSHGSSQNFQLTFLNLSFCPGVTTTSLMELTARCPNLTSLDISGSQVSGKALGEIAARCPNLSYLGLSYCNGVNVSNIQTIAAGCRNLRSLFLLGCDSTTASAIRNITVHYPRLRVVF